MDAMQRPSPFRIIVQHQTDHRAWRQWQPTVKRLDCQPPVISSYAAEILAGDKPLPDLVHEIRTRNRAALERAGVDSPPDRWYGVARATIDGKSLHDHRWVTPLEFRVQDVTVPAGWSPMSLIDVPPYWSGDALDDSPRLFSVRLALADCARFNQRGLGNESLCCWRVALAFEHDAPPESLQNGTLQWDADMAAGGFYLQPPRRFHVLDAAWARAFRVSFPLGGPVGM